MSIKVKEGNQNIIIYKILYVKSCRFYFTYTLFCGIIYFVLLYVVWRTAMFEKLDAVCARYDEISAFMISPDAASDMTKYLELVKEQKKIEPTVEKYREYRGIEKEISDLESMLKNETDAEFVALAKEELDEKKSAHEKCELELRTILVPRDPMDERNVIVEIRAGAGGEEAALFAGVLYRMYGMYADIRKFKIEPMYVNETELGGYREISFRVCGDGAYSRFKYESGTHRVQRVPKTESQGRIQTSTATVAVLPEADEVEIEIAPSDLKIETIKSSGAGGQHINKTESAIRLTHLPSGMVVECQDERSQYKNRDKAMKILRARLYEIKCAEQHEKIANERKSQVGTGDRSEKIRTYNYPQSRVSDHRIGLTLHSFEAILNGDLDELIDALSAADAAKKLEAGGDME